MSKKCYTYILLTFLFMFIGISKVNATNCQYDIYNNGAYFTINFEYTDKFTNDMKYYYCLSSSKLNKVCKDNQASISMFQIEDENYFTDYYIMAENAYSGYYDLSEGFHDGQCPVLHFKFASPVDSWIFHDAGYIYFDLKGAENSNGGGTAANVSADTQFSSSSSRDADKQVIYTYDGTTVNLITKPDGKKQLKIAKGNITKTCDVKDNKSVSCKLSDGTIYKVAKKEIEELWNETSFAYIIELETGVFYITKYSDYESASAHYHGLTVGEDVSAGDDGDYKELSEICSEDNVKRVMKAVGYLGLIIKILIPVGLIVFGIINFSKAVISGKDEDTKKAAMGMMWSFIAAIVVFVLPTIINFVVGLIDGAADGINDYDECRVCIFEPKKCD